MRKSTIVAVAIICLALGCVIGYAIASTKAGDVKGSQAKQDTLEPPVGQVKDSQGPLDENRVNEDQLCQKLEDCYKSVKSVDKKKYDRAFDIYVERLSYLVLVAGTHSSGSKRLDAVFSAIQKESPTLFVPRFITTPAKLEKFIDDMASDDAKDYTFSAYLRKARTMSQWIDLAKQAITARGGFKFDPSVSVIYSQ